MTQPALSPLLDAVGIDITLGTLTEQPSPATPVQPRLPLVLPLAMIKGEPYTELPLDLFIPPEALKIILETFEGPLDLLLYLIRKHSLDILDIPMAQLTRQYMTYVEAMDIHQLELAAEYLLMAALMIDIKSRMLLPKPKVEGEAEPDDPRAELVRRLLEYEQMKLAARRLDGLEQQGRDFSVVDVFVDKQATLRLPDVQVADLSEAWRSILARAKMVKHHRITREQLSVRSHMSRLLRLLENDTFAEFSTLFSPTEGVAVLVVTFLALLELGREQLVEITQQAPLEAIYVRLKITRANTLTLQATDALTSSFDSEPIIAEPDAAPNIFGSL